MAEVTKEKESGQIEYAIFYAMDLGSDSVHHIHTSYDFIEMNLRILI